MRTWHTITAISTVRPVVLVVGDDPAPDRVRDAAASWGGRVRVVVADFGRRNTIPRLLRGAVTRWPIQYWNQQSPLVDALIQRLVRETDFDLGIAVTNFVWPYLRHLPVDAVRIVDTHNIDSTNLARYGATMGPGPTRLYTDLTVRKLRHLERHVFGAADQVWVCSEDEARDARQLVPTAQVAVLPNGVTLPEDPARATREAGRVIFFGRLDYFPNEDGLGWFLDAIWPTIHAARPDATLHVYGAGVRPGLAERLAATPGASLHGRVPDLAPELERAAVSVVPLRAGGGTRLKILEALGAGVPVVSTTVGAEGIPLEIGRDFLAADAPRDFADAVLRVLDDPVCAQRLAQAGRAAVASRYEWATIRAQMAGRLSGAVGTRAEDAAV